MMWVTTLMAFALLLFAQVTTASAQAANTFPTSGNVGIGTTAPDKQLTVQGPISSPGGTMAVIRTTGSNNGVGLLLDSTGTGNNNLGFAINGTTKAGFAWDVTRGFFGIANHAYSNYDFSLRINSDGSLTYHDTSIYPSPERFRINANGDVTVSGNISAKWQDVAEWVPAAHAIPAATVVVLNPQKSNQVIASMQAYDTRVAGVVSAQPGLTLGVRGPDKVLVATTGRVKVKVDATRAAVHIGDLLVTGDKEGVAMKSEPLSLGGTEIHRPGTLIGKALEPLESGVGEILVLLSLQ
jgi:hypothetical protein